MLPPSTLPGKTLILNWSLCCKHWGQIEFIQHISSEGSDQAGRGKKAEKIPAVVQLTVLLLSCSPLHLQYPECATYCQEREGPPLQWPLSSHSAVPSICSFLIHSSERLLDGNMGSVAVMNIQRTFSLQNPPSPLLHAPPLWPRHGSSLSLLLVLLTLRTRLLK